jgi:hypothetical protein
MTTILTLMAISALTSAVLVWLVASRGPCLLLGRSCPPDGFDARFEEAQRSFLSAVQPARAKRHA